MKGNKIIIGSRESRLAVIQSQMVQDFIKSHHPDLEVELLHTLQKLYEKYVPPAVREYIESRETCEGRTGMRSQERRNTANRSNEGILETGEGTWSTENS